MFKMTQNCPILLYKMLVNLKEIIVINLFYNLPYFLFNLPVLLNSESIPYSMPHDWKSDISGKNYMFQSKALFSVKKYNFFFQKHLKTYLE